MRWERNRYPTSFVSLTSLLRAAQKIKYSFKMKIVLVAVPLITTRFPPLSIALLAGQMKADGHQVKSFDFNIETYYSVNEELQTYWTYYKGFQWLDNSHFRDFIFPNIIEKNLQKWADAILAENPDIVGISVTEAPSSVHLAKLLRSLRPDLKIIVGGPRCSKTYDDSTFVPNDYLDAVVHNEGEQTLSDLVKTYVKTGSLQSVPGASVLGVTGEIIFSGLRERVMELDQMPYPDFDDFDLKKYIDLDSPDNWIISLPFYSSRGCPARCNFCMDYKMWDVYYRQKSPKRIADEMLFLSNKYGVKDFHLIELIFNGHHKKMLELCQYLIEANQGISFFGHGRIDPRLDAEALSMLKQAGFKWFIFGLETASNHLLKSMRKGYAKETASRVLKDMGEVGLNCSVNLITGLPGETWADFFETVQFIFDHKEFIASPPAICECILVSGTDIALYPEKFGIKTGPNGKATCSYAWESVDGKNNLETRLLRKEMMVKIFKDLEWGKPSVAKKVLESVEV